MTKLNSHLKKGFISILSLTLILSSLNVYAMDLNNSNIIIEEDNLNKDIILIQDNENFNATLSNQNSSNLNINENIQNQNNFNKYDVMIDDSLKDVNFNPIDIENDSIVATYTIEKEIPKIDLSFLENKNIDYNNLTSEQKEIYDILSQQENILSINDTTKYIDLTNISIGSGIQHTHIYESKYNNEGHWEQCKICETLGKTTTRNYKKHNLSLIGNGPTCDVYVVLGKYVCSDNCGYSKPVERLSHDRPSKINWQDWNHTTHIACQCNRCGGGGGNALSGYHTFNINGKIMSISEMIQNGLNPHSYGILTCTICGISTNLSQHNCYSNTCGICGKTLGPTSTYYISQNVLKDGRPQIDLVNKTTDYVYLQVDSKGYSFGNISTFSLYGGNFIIGTPILVSKNGNIYLYKIPISLKDRNVNITEPLVLFTRWNSGNSIGTIIDGYVNETSLAAENNFYVNVDTTTPTISSLKAIDVSTSNGWTTSKQINVIGTSKLNQIVYISMKKPDGTYIFKNNACTVNNGNFNFTITPNIEASTTTTFTIEVMDDFGNKSSKTLDISNTDSMPPTVISNMIYNNEWSKTKNVTLMSKDFGCGDVSIWLDISKDSKTLSTNTNNIYSRNYVFNGDVYGNVILPVYFQDTLDNFTTKTLTIGYLDNTSPTITKVESSKALGSTSLTVTANDINTTLNKSGSGVSKYIITSTNTTPSEDDSNWQDSNILKVTTPGPYYIFAKDLVGNISNAYEVKNVKVDYTLSVNPNGGSWNNSSTTQDFTITNGDTKTIANPSRTGYTFKNWTLSGINAKFENSIFTMGNTNASLVANWNINQYNVTYIDVVDSINGTQLGKTTKKVNYNSTVRGSDIGSSTSDNAYYNGYYYSSDTSATVSTSGATVYRIFKLRTIDKTSNLTWNDNNNKNGFRPSKYTLKLLRNGALFKQVELTSSQTSYTFSNLTKYDSNGNAFKYTFQVDASDRYKITLDSNGNTITENYQTSTFSVTIPKTISLNGLTGKGNYNVKVNGTFYYNDTLTVTPSSSFTLKDRSGVSTLQANVTQNVNTFTKDNLGTTSGSISLNKTKFAGKFNGTFNFNIKFVMKN